MREYTSELASNIKPQQRAQYGMLDPVAWATESHKLAHSNAYDVPKSGQLGQDYFGKNIPVVNERQSMPGLRLAALLKVIFDDTRELPF